MNSIVERLRNPFHMHDSPTMREAADLIEQQAERIKELEAENSRLTIDNEITGSLIEKLRDTNDARGKALAAQCTETKKLRAELATLRKKIEDAPVVAHITEDGKVFNNGFVRDTDKPLISKEDLQK